MADVRQMLEEAAAAEEPRAMLRAGSAALQAGLDTEAAAAVERMLARHPLHAQLWGLLGAIRRNLQDPVKAEEAFARAAELAPDSPAIVHGHACVRYEAGLPAARLFERAASLAGGGDPAMLLRHAAALFAEGEGDVAITLIEAELVRRPGWIQGHKALARARWLRGERDRFADSIEQALVATPRSSALWQAYLNLLTQAGLFEHISNLVERARQAVGPQRGFDTVEAVARSELGELEAAGALFQRLAPHREPPLIAYYLRFLLRSGRYREAAELGARTAPHDPSHEIWPYLSLAWRLLGDPRWEWLEGDPRLVGVYDIAGALPNLDALAERLRALHRFDGEPLGQSVRGGTQTEGRLFARIEPEIRQLHEAISEAVRAHVAQLPPPQPGHPTLPARREPIRFSGSWSVRLTGGGRHADHVHPDGWFSSALYVVLPEPAPDAAPHAGWLSLGELDDLGIDLPPIRLIEPRPGRLVLFPSTMWHGTRAFADGERLTVAFDVERPR